MLEYAKSRFISIMTDTKHPKPENYIPKSLKEMMTKRGINDWKSRFHAALQEETMQEIVKNLLANDGAWEKNVVRPIEEYIGQCKAFAERLEMLTNFYHSVGSPLDSGDYTRFLQESQTGNCVNLCNSADVYSWVKGQVTNKINSVGVQAVKIALMKSFVDSPETWTSESKGETRAEFDRVMSERCQLGKGAGGAVTISLSATSYFEHVLNQVDATEVPPKADEIVQDMVSQLKTKSKPALKKVGGYSVKHRFILLPKDLLACKYGTEIWNAFRNAVKEIWADTPIILVSPSISDIVCYQTSVANALCDLTELQKWETVYNEGINKKTRHLNNGEFGSSYLERTKEEIEKEKAVKEGRKVPELGLSETDNYIFGTGLSWEHYPSIALRNQDSNRTESEFIKTIFDPIVNYAMKENIIQRKREPGSSDDVYSYVVNLIPDRWENLDVSDYKHKGDDGKYARGEQLFQYLANQNQLVQADWQKPIVLAGSGRFGESYDFSQAKTFGGGKTREVIEDISKQYMRRILRKNTKLFLELRETLCRYYEVVRDLEIREQDFWYGYQVEQFAKYYGFGIIMEEEGKWYALTDDSGNRQAFCSFTYKETNDYNDVEKKLYKEKWNFLLAIKKFTELNQNKLKEILDDKLNDTAQEDLEVLQKKNNPKLGEMCRRIQKEILEKYPNRTTDDAIRKTFDIGTGAGVFYIKIMESILEQWEEFIGMEMSETPKGQGNKIIEETIVPSETWKCPECGEVNPSKAKRCMECGAVNPNLKNEWKCPECGEVNPSKAKRCMECGAVNPNLKKEEPTEWKCPECGEVNPSKAKRCMECGTKKN